MIGGFGHKLTSKDFYSLCASIGPQKLSLNASAHRGGGKKKFRGGDDDDVRS